MGPRTGQERQDRMAARIDQVVTAGVNIWIIGDDEEVIVVDPGTDAEAVLAAAGEFEVADITLEVMHTPGHSAGSVCLYCEELGAVFCGDLLAADGLVTSEDGFSNFARQLSSIGENLLTLAPETRVLPGHGPEFTVAAAEKNFDSWVSAGPGAGLAADLDEDED
jgi:glyoxylase-like metal-dependent hydrolase (beta-lactamase superfamily II)